MSWMGEVTQNITGAQADREEGESIDTDFDIEVDSSGISELLRGLVTNHSKVNHWMVWISFLEMYGACLKIIQFPRPVVHSQLRLVNQDCTRNR